MKLALFALALLAAPARGLVGPVVARPGRGAALARARHPPQRLPSRLLAVDASGDGAIAKPARTAAVLAVWASFVGYAALGAPGVGDPAAAAADAALLQTIIADPFSGTIEPLFVGVFNSLGLLPVIFSSLLLPGAKEQPVPALPFCAGSMFLGAFALAPYLAVRELATDVPRGTAGPVGRALDSRVAGVGVLAGALALVGWVGSAVLADGDVAGHVAAYRALFEASTFANVSTLDFSVLSLLLMWSPLGEDMRRRGVHSNALAAAIVAVPLLGPAAYLAWRPRLPEYVEPEPEPAAAKSWWPLGGK